MSLVQRKHSDINNFLENPSTKRKSTSTTINLSLKKRESRSISEDDVVRGNIKKIKMIPSSGLICVIKDSNETSGTPSMSYLSEEEGQLPRVNSLAFQLSCVNTAAVKSLSGINSQELLPTSFPDLPKTISDSSCTSKVDDPRKHVEKLRSDSSSTLTAYNKNSSNWKVSDSSNTFGWFVEIDDNKSEITSTQDIYKSPIPDDLAFSAPVAPIRACKEKEEAELAWAQAADTVDDVLGDFF